MSFEIGKVTRGIIGRLYADGNLNRAVLASLRGAATINSPKAQPVWPIIFAALDRKYLSEDGTPTHAEVAIFAALRLFAIQQQGRETPVYLMKKDASDSNLNFFSRLAKLRGTAESSDALDRRFQTLVSATTVDSVIHSLVSLGNIVKSNDKTGTIDFPRLAEDLYWFQANFEYANRIKLSWGEKYYRTENSQQKAEEITDHD